MKIIEVGTGYTSIPANMGAATEIVVEELSKSFQNKKINYEIFDVKDENRKKTNLKIREVNIPKCFRKKDTTLGILHKFKRVLYSLSLAKSLKKEIKFSKENLYIHFHNQYNMFFFLIMTSKKIRKRVHLFYTVHSYIWNNEWEKISSIIRKKYFQEVYSIKKADKVFVLNNITANHFINHLGIDEKRLVQIDNGVNTEIYKEINSNQEKFVFFQSGSVCERKNQLGAIKNLTKLLQDDERYKYLYAGGIIDSKYKDAIDTYVYNNNLKNKVEYVGELQPGEQINKFYNSAKAFIFPSTAEAFSLVILEAMSCGLPVIMNKKNILEVSDDLKKVILFYENQESFDNLIKNYILNEQERKKICKKSRDIAVKKYSWDVISNKYLNEFKNNN